MSTMLKIKIIVSTSLFMAVISSGLYIPAIVRAATITCPNGTHVDAPGGGLSTDERTSLCQGNNTPSDPNAPVQEPTYVQKDCPNDENPDLSQHNCGIIRYLVIFIKALSAVVGVVVVANIIIGGIQYSASADDPKAVAAAKSRIFNSVLALVSYFFIFALLQYLVPGGVLGAP